MAENDMEALAAKLEEVQEFLREPDYAEEFGTGAILDWINRRPTHIIPSVTHALAALRSTTAEPNPAVAADGEEHDRGATKLIAFLEEAACYFANRPTGGEDKAMWANVYNSENCAKTVELIRLLFGDIKDLDEQVATWAVKYHNLTRGPNVISALQAIANLPTGRNEDVMEGHEQAYRAVEALFTTPPHIEVRPTDSAAKDEEIAAYREALASVISIADRLFRGYDHPLNSDEMLILRSAWNLANRGEAGALAKERAE